MNANSSAELRAEDTALLRPHHEPAGVGVHAVHGPGVPDAQPPHAAPRSADRAPTGSAPRRPLIHGDQPSLSTSSSGTTPRKARNMTSSEARSSARWRARIGRSAPGRGRRRRPHRRPRPRRARRTSPPARPEGRRRALAPVLPRQLVAVPDETVEDRRQLGRASGVRIGVAVARVRGDPHQVDGDLPPMGVVEAGQDDVAQGGHDRRPHRAVARTPELPIPVGSVTSTSRRPRPRRRSPSWRPTPGR